MQVRVFKMCFYEVRTLEVRTGEVHGSQEHAVEVGATKVSALEVWHDLMMFASIFVPSFDALLEDFEMFRVGHRQ